MASAFLFLRPRRFGKSLFISTLNYYFNKTYLPKYKYLFGNLQIYNDAEMEKEHNTYKVLSFDFSNLDVSGDVNTFRSSLNNIINRRVKAFKKEYNANEIEINQNDSIDTLESLFIFVNSNTQENERKIWVFIDEYNTQVNQILREEDSELAQHLKDEKKRSNYRLFFSTLKKACSENGYMKIFITGVTPIVMNEFTSGFNIALNLTHLLSYSALCGIEKKDLERAIGSLDYKDKNKLIEIMIDNYNGYKFHPEQKEKLINPTLANYFLTNLKRDGHPPIILLDENTSLSDNAIKLILENYTSEELVRKLIVDKTIQSEIGKNINFENIKNEESSMILFLYYLGALTHDKIDRFNKNHLTIPNEITRNEYLNEILKISHLNVLSDLEGLRKAVNNLIPNKDIKPLCQAIDKNNLSHLRFNDVVHFRVMDLKAVFIFALSLTGHRKILQNEYHVKMDKLEGYLDLVLLSEEKIHIELKNITKAQLNWNVKLDWTELTQKHLDLKNKNW